MTLGIGVGVDTTGILPNRRNTLIPGDFAYWASTFIADGKPEDYSDSGPETNSSELISWAALQAGLEMPSTIDTYCVSGRVTVAEALGKRGALLFKGTDIAVTLGLNDLLEQINGRYFIHKPTTLQLADWSYGALIPGLEYR
jgi:hypothetical protein